jgi:leukotriene-A4 hydrolase
VSGIHTWAKNVFKEADILTADEGYSQVAYEKGSNLLLHIERLVGGLDVFIPYMKDYDRTFTGTSITTDQWRNHMFHYFGSLPEGDELVKKLSKLDWDEVSRGIWTNDRDLCRKVLK